MKHLLIIAAMATMVASCKNKTKEETKVLSATEQADSIEFAKFKEQKAKNEAVAAYKASHPVAAAPAPAATTAAPKKKGWSKAAKGAVIGAGTGAVAGAIINKKNRAAGAVIGGVVGGGVGYGVGRSMDKKDGRN
jgi:Glycine zipper